MVSPEDPPVLTAEGYIGLSFGDTKAEPIVVDFDPNLPDEPPSYIIEGESSPGPSVQHNPEQSSISFDPVEASSFWRKLLFWKKRSPQSQLDSPYQDCPLNPEDYEFVLCVERETEPTFTLRAKLGEVQKNQRVIHFQGSAGISTPPLKQITFVIQFTDLEKHGTPLSIKFDNVTAVDSSSPVTIKQTDHSLISATATVGGHGGSFGAGASTGRDMEYTTTAGIKFKGMYGQRREISFTWKAPPMLPLDGECQFQVGIPNTVRKGAMANFRVRCEFEKAILLQSKLKLPAKKARNWHSLKLQLAQVP
ncbi:hypothetical protein F5887DRAFT_131399 [Amanita rubescens]|nr:hypothetical protein F5887DRAFT_131399 [Amanita rubescens]